MEHTTYASRLRYLDAEDVDNGAVRFAGMDVQGTDGSKLGNVDGFIVDAQAGRAYYVVVDSGGWFRSRQMLVPVGHATLDGDSLRLDLTRDALTRYPEFDVDRFQRFSDEELRQFESAMVSACCPGDTVEDASVRSWAYDTRRHYAQPSWWRSEPDTIPRAGSPRSRVSTATPIATASDTYQREHVRARDTRPGDDVSPHHEGRAQPGDVLGIETGGERTYVGETAEDEDTRRRDALRKGEE